MVPRRLEAVRRLRADQVATLTRQASNWPRPRFPAVTIPSPTAPKFLLICSSGVLLLGACARTAGDSGKGDADTGAIEITRDACGSCHVIPGIEESQGRVGPSLSHFGNRQMIAGRLANTQANLQRWLKSPQSIAPGTAMPDQGLTDRQARDIAAYLERLR